MFDFFVKQKKLAQVFTVSILLIGFLALNQIQKDRFPNVDFETMVISTIYPNSSPEDVENDVTIPIEDELKKLSDLEEFISTSKEGLSLITVVISQDADDVATVKQRIRDAVNSVIDLPSEAKIPKVDEIKTSRMEVLQVNLTGNLEYKTLRKITDNIIDKLELLNEVAEVNEDGELDTEIKIYLDPHKIKKYKLSLTNVINQIKGRNYRYTVGDDNNIIDNKNIVVLEKFKNLSTLKDLILKSNFDGNNITLRDVATIKTELEEQKLITRVNSINGFVLKVRKSQSADVIKTVDKVKQEINKIQKQYPQGLSVFYTNDLSKDVRNRLGIVTNNGIIGFVMVLFVLGIFLSIRAAFWVAIGMTVSLLGTVISLWFIGETINLVSLAAIVLVLGIVVDDSIIMAESIQNAMEKDNSNFAIVNGVKRVIKPVVTTILTSILAIGSMFLMEGTMGKFIYAIPLVVIFALSFSLLEIIIALPAHMASGSHHKSRVWFAIVENIYFKIIGFILRLRYLILILFIIVAIFTVNFTKDNMNFNLFPSKGADTINVRFKTKVGSSLEYTASISKKVEEIIQQQVGDELSFINSTIGSSRENSASIKIRLIPSDENRTDAQKIINNLEKATANITEIERIYFSIRRPGPPRGRDIELELVSDNDLERTTAMNKLEKILTKIDGVSSIRRDDVEGKKRHQIIFDFPKMAALGVDFSSVQYYLKAAFSGIEISSVRQEGKEIEYRIFIGADKQKITVIDDIHIANKQGRLIPISSFIMIKNINGESNLNHFNGRRSVQISASINDKKNTSTKVVNQALKELDIEKNFSTVRVLNEGGAKDSNNSMSSLIKAFSIAVIGIFFLLVLLFNSYTQPIIILSAIPFSLVGVIWAFYLHGEDLSFFAILGSLALVGVIVNDSLVMVSHLNDIKKNNNHKNKTIMWIAQGSTDRLRAVILTSITTLVGVLPLAYGIGGVDYLLQPMALSLGYGLLFGTLVTLVLLPCLYLINYEIVQFFVKKKARNT